MTIGEGRGREGRDNSLLLLDDDAPLRIRLGRALQERGFAPVLAESVAEALAAVRASPPAFAVLDMRLGDGSGLTVVDALRRARPGARIIMLTGYANLAATAAAMKAMAVDYLAKHADADQIVTALKSVKGPGSSPA
jgi:two-component system response regulator RegA